MRSHFKHEIQFVKHRRVLFAISIVLIVVAIVGVAVRGINLGIDFIGGTQVSFNDAGDITISDMRDAFAQGGAGDAVVQTTQSGDTRGFLVRTNETDPSAANELAAGIASQLGLADNSYQVTTIGPNWGSDVTRSSAIAFVVVIALIIAFVSVRYELKMSLMAVLSLLHVLIIVIGVYAWAQLEVTPNVVAALLTIMGYCLYDTVVVFNRVNENMRSLKDGVHRTALQITNFSENQVIVRSVNTALCSLVPVGAMLLFGGETLKGFAFAMFLGLSLGAYSSIAIAAPLYALWKGREERWAQAEQRYGENATDAGKDR
ncbi:MAG: protein translocase subunit SecF [Coriobacteriia bacterium]|nr:protein translocase subunit SecF [Coriobacteriia bacterium]MBS5477637.1 protein translocase subunit SecF [Coriobacteriia bacterium]